MSEKTTPMMQQWHQCKSQAKESILLFRLGDFYEAFYDDAQLLSQELQLTLTKRQGIPMSGVPVHAIDNYLNKLINNGHKVAIAEQTQDPKSVKGIVKREIVRVISPATYIDKPHNDPSNQYFVCIVQVNTIFGLAILDLSTGDLQLTEVEQSTQAIDELIKIKPKELLVSKKFYRSHKEVLRNLKLDLSYRLNVKEDWNFDFQLSYEWLTSHFGVASLDGFGAKHMTASINAAGGLLSYVSEELHHSIAHIKSMSPLLLKNCMSIDAATFKHLELFNTSSKEGLPLIELLDRTCTAMGKRQIRHLVAHPLIDIDLITTRQDACEYLLNHLEKLKLLAASLKNVRDIERLIMRITSNYAGPRDIKALGQSLQELPHIESISKSIPLTFFEQLIPHFFDVSSITQIIEDAIVEAPPIKLTEGGIFKSGFNEELDQWLAIKNHSEQWLSEYQLKLQQELGIKTLKVGFSKAFGYFIEVSRLQAKNIPPSFHKRQTLVNTERFISQELKEFENKIYHASEHIEKIEYQLFQELKKQIAEYDQQIRSIAKAIGLLDCIVSFAEVANDHQYIRPKLTNDCSMHIKEGRHPTLEASLTHEKFISNDTYLDPQDCQLMLITGPNMAGKSTYIRQVALIAIMAQIGCFVPAKEASIGVIDRVFSRIGASDDLARGQSTFMVEMTETANILHNATDRSLVILDEIGRGTSTYDGVSIAWAVAEFFLSTPGKQAKTLFATHYHELASLSEEFPRAKNYSVAIHEQGDEIIFLRKIIAGSADKSYGVHVAKLAGLPSLVIQRAKEKLKTFEKSTLAKKEVKPKKSLIQDQQFLLFPSASQDETTSIEMLKDIKQLEIEKMTPVEAFEFLIKWKKLIKQ